MRLFTRMKERDADPSYILKSFSQNLQSNQILLTRILTGPEISVKVMNLSSAECRRSLIRFLNLRRRKRYVSILIKRLDFKNEHLFSCFNHGTPWDRRCNCFCPWWKSWCLSFAYRRYVITAVRLLPLLITVTVCRGCSYHLSVYSQCESPGWRLL